MHELKDISCEKKFNIGTSDDIHNLLEWTEDSFELNYNIVVPKMPIINNYIYYFHFGYTIGSEQAYDRPALVVHTTKESRICIVIPITKERLGDKIPYHIDLDNGKGTALVEQIRTISKVRVYGKLFYKQEQATITENDRMQINRQLMYLCQLRPLWKNK